MKSVFLLPHVIIVIVIIIESIINLVNLHFTRLSSSSFPFSSYDEGTGVGGLPNSCVTPRSSEYNRAWKTTSVNE